MGKFLTEFKEAYAAAKRRDLVPVPDDELIRPETPHMVVERETRTYERYCPLTGQVSRVEQTIITRSSCDCPAGEAIHRWRK
jgi:hypothetical protein